MVQDMMIARRLVLGHLRFDLRFGPFKKRRITCENEVSCNLRTRLRALPVRARKCYFHHIHVRRHEKMETKKEEQFLRETTVDESPNEITDLMNVSVQEEVEEVAMVVGSPERFQLQSFENCENRRRMTRVAITSMEQDEATQ